MTGLWKYFEEHDAIFAAVVAAVGIVGAVVGAKIQANGGRDQAAAAREAAKIAAEAQHVAALWNVRQVQIADFIRNARELRRLLDRYYEEDPGGWLGDEAKAIRQGIDTKFAEIELIAVKAVVDAAGDVRSSIESYMDEAVTGGWEGRARLALRNLSFSDDENVSRAAIRASQGFNESDRDTRLQLLRAVPGLSIQHARLLASTAGSLRWLDERNRKTEIFEQRLAVLVEAARVMLRAEGDVAPAPPQRRWWRRAAV
ncbi:hypothetical protein ABTX77_36430 [Streptomyces sp. NPDC097704]|uniref:hypothetical protein n=1 Tax=Streptomyces sp. NPDC097704 TaxID=3157101 RepID=UPI00331C096D